MSRITSKNPEATHPMGRPGAKDPSVVMARDQLGDIDNPYLVREHYPDDTVCSRCGALVRDQRWVIDEERKALLLAAGTTHQVECPACLKTDERQPGGILTLRGDYWPRHRNEILRLVRNEAAKQCRDNPTERIMEVREESGSLVIATTNEKLAQHLGRSLHRAHKGSVHYQWGDGARFARVTWERAA